VETPPSALRRLVIAPFQAGLLGAGVFLWAAGGIISLQEGGLLVHGGDAEAWRFALALLLAVGVALARGYRGPVRSYPALIGRLVGALAAGTAVITASLMAAASWLDHLESDRRPLAVALAGVALALAGFAWIHGRRLADELRASRRLRIRAGALAAGLALATAWLTSPVVRCDLGSGRSCFEAASRAIDEGNEGEDDRRGVELAERGCSFDSAACCLLAGKAYWRRASLAPERRARLRPGAEHFFREACALSDAEGCRLLHAVELDARCEAYQASACHELADVYRSGWLRDEGDAARRLRQACLLGDAEACAGGR
jgi:hypothetical protein